MTHVAKPSSAALPNPAASQAPVTAESVVAGLATARERLAMVLGPWPGDPARRVPLDVQTVAEHQDGSLHYRKITFVTEPGDRCPAWLITPLGPARSAAEALRPAMLCLHQTTRIGKDETAGLGGLPTLHTARELALRGYVCLAPDYPGFGEYRMDCYALGWASASLKGAWNHHCAVDLLAALPGVDAARIGVVGHSLGGFNALLAALYDERLRCCVSSCGFTRFTWNDDEGRGTPGDLTDWSHGGYMPRIASHYGCRAERLPWDFPDVLGLLAPRPLFINAPLDDFFQAGGVDECVDLVRTLFAPGSLELVHPACQHGFPDEARAAAWAFVDRQLR